MSEFIPDISLLVLFPAELEALSKATTTGDRDAIFQRIDETISNVFAIDQIRASLACTGSERINGCRWWPFLLSISQHPSIESLDLLESSEMTNDNLNKMEMALLSVLKYVPLDSFEEGSETFKTDWRSGWIGKQIRTMFDSVRKASAGDLGTYARDRTVEAHEVFERVRTLPSGEASRSEREESPDLDDVVEGDTVDWCGTHPMFTKESTKVVPTPELRTALKIGLPALERIRRGR